IRTASGSLPAAVGAAFAGRPDESIALIAGVLKAYSPELEVLTSQGIDQSALGSLFRMRIGSAAGRHQLGDLFHIPFNSRHLITNQRYSFPGLPCLYLGQSLYVCWEELGRPDLNGVVISRFRLRTAETVKVL